MELQRDTRNVDLSYEVAKWRKKRQIYRLPIRDLENTDIDLFRIYL